MGSQVEMGVCPQREKLVRALFVATLACRRPLPRDRAMTAGGDSNWSFVYYLEYAGPNRLKLRVHRDHDNQEFTGEFTR